MTPMCVLPPVPAVWGDGWQDEWRHRLETNEPWVLTWLRENTHGDYWRGGSVRLGADGRATSGSSARRCWSPAGRTATATTRSAPSPSSPRTASRTGCSPGRGRTPTRRRRSPARGSTSTWSWPRGSTAGCGRVRDARRASKPPHRATTSPTATSSSARPPGPEPDLELHEGYWVRLPSVPPVPPVLRRARRPPPAARAARHRHHGLDRLRRSPPVGPLHRPAPRRRPVPDLGRRPAGRPDRRPATRPAPGQRRRPRGLAVGEALRRLPRRHLGAGLPRHARPGVPRRRPRRSRRRWCPATSTTSRSTWTPAPTSGPPATGSGSASPAPTGRTPSLPRPRSRSPRTAGRWCCPSLEGDRPGADLHRRRGALHRDDGRRRLGDPRRRAPPDHDRPHAHRLRLRHPVRRPRPRGLPRRGQRRPPYLRAARALRDVLDLTWPGIAVSARSVMDLRYSTRRCGRRDRHLGRARRPGDLTPRVARDDPPLNARMLGSGSGAQVQDADLEELVLVLVTQEDVPREQAGRLEALELVGGRRCRIR